MSRNARKQRRAERSHGVVVKREKGRWAAPLLVALITFAVFAPALKNDFVTFDDERNFVSNLSYRGVGLRELHWMWTTVHMGHYVPLSWMTLGVDYTLWGMRPAGYHFTNIILHAGVAVLAFLVSQRLLRAGGVGEEKSAIPGVFVPALAALLFALHPLRVESVAWVTERRDVLSALFGLGSVLAYLRACESSGSRSRSYRWSLALFVCGLLSKATIMTLPALLLVIDVYPLRRLGGASGWWGEGARRVYREKIPYLLGSMAAAVVSIVALPARPQLGVLEKIAVSAYGLSFYVWKTLIPMQLSPLYPMPRHIEATGARYLVGAAVVIAISALAWATRRRWPGLAAAWISFVILTLPMLGAVQNGPQITADRYTYHAGLALAILAAAGIARARARRSAGIASVAVLVLFAVLTSHQLQVWHDSIGLWTHVTKVEPQSALAHNGLADALESTTPPRFEEAIAHYRHAIALSPDYDEAHNNLGTALAMSGSTEEAITQFRRALALNPRLETAHFNWGNALFGTGDVRGAIDHYQAALRLKPDDGDAVTNLAIARHRLRAERTLDIVPR